MNLNLNLCVGNNDHKKVQKSKKHHAGANKHIENLKDTYQMNQQQSRYQGKTKKF